MIKRILRKIFLLDRNRYEGDADFFRTWKIIDPDGTFNDGIIRSSVANIPNRIIPVYMFYINFNVDYFFDLIWYSFLFNFVVSPFSYAIHPIVFFIPGIAYFLLCIILNCVITVLELIKIKKDMIEIYYDLMEAYQIKDDEEF